MSTQRAFRFDLTNRRVVEDTVAIPDPKPNQVILQVLGAGLCGSDHHVREHHLKVWKDHFIGGHEIAGKIVLMGSDVDPSKVRVGDRYTLHTANPCFECNTCKRGYPNICLNNLDRGFGLAIDGGWQQYMAISNLKCLVKIPDNVSYEVAAVTSDSVLTPYHAIKRANLTPASKVLLIGAGGLGMNAAQIIKAFNAYLVVVDLKASLKEKVLSMGADEFYTDMTKSKHKASSFDVVVDLCGFTETYGLGLHYVRHRGKLVAIGLGKGKLVINLAKICNKEVQLIGNYYGTVEELAECLELVSKGLVAPDFQLLPFKNVHGVITDLAAGKINGRAVFNPNSKL